MEISQQLKQKPRGGDGFSSDSEDEMSTSQQSQRSNADRRMNISGVTMTTTTSQGGEDTLENQPHKNFTQLCPVDQYKKGDRCVLCAKEFSGLFSSNKNCNFCGRCVCKSCLTHSRRDPQDSDKIASICDLCHHQILYSRILKSYNVQKEQILKQRKFKQEECEQHRIETQKKLETNEEAKVQIQTQKIKYTDSIEEMKEQVRVVKVKHQKGVAENTQMKERIVILTQEMESNKLEIANLRAQSYENNSTKCELKSRLSAMEAQQTRTQLEFDQINSDINNRRLESNNLGESTDFFDQPRRQIDTSLSDRTFITSVINAKNMTFNQYSSFAPLHTSSGPHPKRRKNRKQVTEGGACCKQQNCSMF